MFAKQAIEKQRKFCKEKQSIICKVYKKRQSKVNFAKPTFLRKAKQSNARFSKQGLAKQRKFCQQKQSKAMFAL